MWLENDFLRVLVRSHSWTQASRNFPNFVLACRLHNTAVWQAALLLLTGSVSTSDLWRKQLLCCSCWRTCVRYFLSHISWKLLRAVRLNQCEAFIVSKRSELGSFLCWVWSILSILHNLDFKLIMSLHRSQSKSFLCNWYINWHCVWHMLRYIYALSKPCMCFSACWQGEEVHKIIYRVYLQRAHCLHKVPRCLWSISTVGVHIHIVDLDRKWQWAVKREPSFLRNRGITFTGYYSNQLKKNSSLVTEWRWKILSLNLNRVKHACVTLLRMEKHY